jgi:hypothetical protein
MICGNFQGANDWAAQNLYAAVVSAVAVKIFFTLVAVLGMNSIQLDIVTTFFNATAKSKTPIYVFQPTGFSDGIKRVYKLNRALYGLRKSPVWWYETICPYLQTIELEPMLADQCLFKHKNKGILILFYVNNFRITTFLKFDEN